MRTQALTVLVFIACLPAFGQDAPDISLSLSPGASVPVGPDAAFFSYGAGADFTAGFDGLVPVVSPRITLGYDYVPLATLGSVSLLRAGAGLALPFRLAPSLRLSPYLLGGYTYGFISDGSGQGGGLFVKGGLELSLLLGQVMSLGLDASYRWDIGAWGGVGISLSSGVRLPLSRSPAGQRAIKGIELLSEQLAAVFPAQFKLYDNRPFGTFTLHNLEKSALTDVTVDFYVSSYMDNPTRLLRLPKLEPGGHQDVSLRALFSEQVLKITEATKVSGKVSVSFVLDGQPYTRDFTETVRINNRNSITWDDTRKAATFVTPNDPLVLTLGKNAVAVTSDVPSGQVDKWLIAAMAMHEALKVKGLRYSTNPNTPFSDVLHNASVIDTVLFPPEELSYGAGNCSDLTVLYCALLESVGAHTAFITTPGHIYAAVQLDVPPDQISRTFARPQDLIIQDGRTWLPVEVTMCSDPFVDAWRTGAEEWREFQPQGKTEFLPVEASWQVYEPVGQIPALATEVKLPDLAAMASAYKSSFRQFVDQELTPRVSQGQKDIASHKGDPRPLNSLGVLYAQFGRNDLAAAQFEAASRMGDYLPALINLANIRFLARDFNGALQLYQKAAVHDQKNALAILGIARSDAGLEKFDDARAEFAALQAVNPALAKQFAYLGDQGTSQSRAASADEQSNAEVWDEESQS
jgi:hypothetical protein